MQHDIEKGLMNPYTTVVIDITELSESIHEEAYARAGGSNHLGECFLSIGGSSVSGSPG